ncbi:adenylate kinase [Taklimakanibacter lacteus]|uniref:adenylate kinase n=1 Tax=Taklimakanibacter lacteus TaxID=2268456 RepID=UPI000E669DFD
MKRVAVIGNAGGGKSTLARRLADKLGQPYHEIDALLWAPGWILQSEEVFEAAHQKILAEERWVIDGLGRLDSIEARLRRATDIVLVDMPLWRHFSFAAKRQLAWATGKLSHPPAGLSEMPDMDALFETMWLVDKDWMPKIRIMVAAEEAEGKPVTKLGSPSELDEYQAD